MDGCNPCVNFAKTLRTTADLCRAALAADPSEVAATCTPFFPTTCPNPGKPNISHKTHKGHKDFPACLASTKTALEGASTSSEISTAPFEAKDFVRRAIVSVPVCLLWQTFGSDVVRPEMSQPVGPRLRPVHPT